MQGEGVGLALWAMPGFWAKPRFATERRGPRAGPTSGFAGASLNRAPNHPDDQGRR
jgi:hypothetical protein